MLNILLVSANVLNKDTLSWVSDFVEIAMSVFSQEIQLAIVGFSVSLGELVASKSWQNKRLVTILYMVILEKLTQGFLRLRASRFPEVLSSDWGVLVLTEVSKHFRHVCVSTNSDQELFKHLG